MDGDPLDNPAWLALSGPHRHLAIVEGAVRRYRPDIALFSGFDRVTPGMIATLPSLVPEGGVVGVLRSEPIEVPSALDAVVALPLRQMVGGTGLLPDTGVAEMVPLGDADVPDMLDLVHLTEPGPFARRTIEMGSYFGIRLQGKLAAMAGERMRLDGFTEVSAVCTHPDFRRRGYAAALVRHVANGISARGERPFLHVRVENAAAISTYEALGFSIRRTLSLQVLRRASVTP